MNSKNLMDLAENERRVAITEMDKDEKVFSANLGNSAVLQME
jgi:hypothetical protein